MDLNFNTAAIQREPAERPPVLDKDPLDAFKHEMMMHGYQPDNISSDGSIHRFQHGGGKNKDGFYALHIHNSTWAYGFYGSWKTGVKIKWNNTSDFATDSIDWEEYRRVAQEIMEKAEIEKESAYSDGKRTAQALWEKSPPATEHPYLKKKEIHAYDLRLANGDLLVPYRDIDGEINTLQKISADGAKKYHWQGKKDGCFHTIPGDGNKVYICEGYATGASIAHATGATTIIAGDTQGLKSVTPLIMQKHSDKEIVICADHDQWTVGNPGMHTATAICREYPTVTMILPQFEEIHFPAKPTDFNDLACLAGISTVRAQILEHQDLIAPFFPPASDETTILLNRIITRPPPREFILNIYGKGLLPKGIVGVITATGGVGKSFFMMGLANCIAGGSPMGPITTVRPAKVLMIAGEDDEDEIIRRLWDIADGGNFPPNLHAMSVFGEVGPLMKLDAGNNPVRGEGFDWLEKTIQQHEGLEVLILDPKSRFYGLNENDSDHSTQWMQSLEYLAKKYDLTIFFSHHTSKQNARGISQEMGRGSSAIVDACRWQAGMVRMPKEDGEKFSIDYRKHVIIDFPKMNYSEDVSNPLIFRRGQNGVFEHAEPHKDMYQEQTEYLWQIIKNNDCKFSRRDYVLSKAASPIFDEMKEQFDSFSRRKTAGYLIDALVEQGKLRKETVIGKTNKKDVLVINV